MLNTELRNKIVEENKYIDLLNANPQYMPQGYDMKSKKHIVGIIKGDPSEYRQERDHLNFKSFDSWKDAYIQLTEDEK